MKVKDLIEKLNKLDSNLEVLCYTEDESLVDSGSAVKALDIIDVSKTKLSVLRDPSGILRLSFSGENSDRAYALVEITSDL